MKQIDLNCDMGELKPHQERNYDEEIMPYISSCNIACGFHSGSPTLIAKTIELAVLQGVMIGAHPSYNDRENFGRKSLQVDSSILMSELKYQICAVKGMVESYGQKLHHVKPHGALYNDMAAHKSLADMVVQLIKKIDPNLKIFALAHSHVVECCEKNGMQYVNEGFADRRYQSLTALRSREFVDAVIHDKEDVLSQIGSFLDGKVQLWDGTIEGIKIDSICLHSDTKGAVELSQFIHDFLKKENVEITAMV